MSIALALVVRTAVGRAGVIPVWANVPDFFLMSLGASLAPVAFPSAHVALTLGCVAIALFGSLSFATFYWLGSSPALRWVALATCSLVAAFLIALGRSYAGEAQALASHYVTATYPLVVALLALAGQLLLAWSDRDRRQLGSTLALLALLGLAGIELVSAGYVARGVVREVTSWHGQNVAASEKLVLGTASDDEIRATTYPSPPFVRAGIATLRALGLTTFAPCRGGPPRGGVDGSVAAGETTSLVAMPGRPWALAGWAVGANGRAPVASVRLEIEGQPPVVAELGLARSDLVRATRRTAWAAAGWKVVAPPFAASPTGRQSFRVVAVSCDGTMSELARGEVVVR